MPMPNALVATRTRVRPAANALLRALAGERGAAGVVVAGGEAGRLSASATVSVFLRVLQ